MIGSLRGSEEHSLTQLTCLHQNCAVILLYDLIKFLIVVRPDIAHPLKQHGRTVYRSLVLFSAPASTVAPSGR